ncbi:Na(+)/citrate cotransporter-like isoform X2 [Dermacentor albipictus]
MSERTAFVSPSARHRPSCALALLQGADSDALLGRADEGAVMHRVSASSTPRPSRLESPQIVNREESAWQNPEKARAPSGVRASAGIQGFESPRALLSPIGTAAAALAAAASYAPFVGVDYDLVTGPRADGGEAAMGPEAASAADAGATDLQLPDTGAGTGRPYRPRGLWDGVALKPLFDLLVQLDCFWLAQDLFSGDTQRVQSSIRVLATMALLLLVLWLAAVPNSAEKSWRASSVGLLLMASLTMDLVAAPMASLLPFLCMPLLELADARAAALPYSTVRQMSFLCAMLLVLTMEECGLPTRLALLILSHTGHKINSILALVIAVAVTMTCLLDAFCVTVLMMSTVECIVDEIYIHVVEANVPSGMADPGQRPCRGGGASPNAAQQRQSMESSEHLSYFAYRRYIFSECTTYIRDERNTLFKAMMAAVVYGSNIGSSGTSRGSQQSYYLLHFLRQTYNGGTTLNYVTWTVYSAPSVVASAVFLWWHLCRRFVPRALQGAAQYQNDTDPCHEKYAAIRRIGYKSYEAVAIMMMAAYVNCSLVDQDWININNTSAVRSQTMMVGLTSLAFMAPARRSRGSAAPAIVSTDVIQTRFPWGVFLLAGAGCAMTLCFKLGEVSALRLELVSAAADIHPSLGVALLFTIQCFLVEMKSSHDSVLHLMAPMVSLASERNWNPLLLLLPVTKGASMVFLLPVSCYGNALLFDYARMSCWEMIKIGFPVKIVTIVLELLSLLTVGNALFDLGHFPAWATVVPPTTTISAFNASTLDDILNITSAL